MPGTMEAIAGTMQRHHGVSVVQELACYTLWLLLRQGELAPGCATRIARHYRPLGVASTGADNAGLLELATTTGVQHALDVSSGYWAGQLRSAVARTHAGGTTGDVAASGRSPLTGEMSAPRDDCVHQRDPYEQPTSQCVVLDCADVRPSVSPPTSAFQPSAAGGVEVPTHLLQCTCGLIWPAPSVVSAESLNSRNFMSFTTSWCTVCPDNELLAGCMQRGNGERGRQKRNLQSSRRGPRACRLQRLRPPDSRW